MRLFFALELDPANAEALGLAVAPLRKAEPELLWVPTAKLHLTMKFLGDVEDASATPLAGAADAVSARHRPFTMTLEGVGAFPNFRRARVVWMGIDAEPRLELLHHDLEVACRKLGYEVEGRAFRPHVTLARMRAPLAPDRVRRFARLARRVTFAVTEKVTRLTLCESTLSRDGAGMGYRRLHGATLGGR